MADSILLTIKDVQEATQLGRTKIYELMRDGDLPYLRIGRSVRIRRDALDLWLSKQEVTLRTLPPRW